MRRFFGRVRRLFDTPAGISVGRMGTQSLSLITAPIIAQAIGPSGRGWTAASIAAITITGVVIGLGVPLAVRRRAVIETDRASLVRTARLFAWFTAIPSIGLGLLLAVTLLQGLDLAAHIAFLVAMTTSALTVSWVIDTQVFVADRRYFRILWLGSIQTVTYFSVVLVLWLADSMSIAGVIWAYASGTVAAFLLGRWWNRQGKGKVKAFGSLFREGLKLWGSQAAEIASARLDQLLVLPIIGAAPAGLYSVAATIGALPVSIGLGLGTSAFRGFVEDRSKDRVERAIRMAFAVALTLAVVVGVVGIWGIPWLFGEDFSGAVPLTFITLAGGVAVVGSYICSMALTARERGLTMTGVQVAGLVVGIALLIPAGNAWGAMGAAAASTIGYVATLGGSLLALRVRPWNAIPRPADFAHGFRTFLGRA